MASLRNHVQWSDDPDFSTFETLACFAYAGDATLYAQQNHASRLHGRKSFRAVDVRCRRVLATYRFEELESVVR